MTETPLLAKDDGMDVAAWNAANPLHPRGGDGRFADHIGSALRKLAEDYGDVITHEELGEPDHHFSDRGALAVHNDGTATLSRVDDEGDVHHVADGLTHSDITEIQERVSEALDDLESGGHPNDTHLELADDPDELDGAKPLPVRVQYGIMADGTRYVALAGDDDADSIQLTPEHAEDFRDVAEGLASRQFTYDHDKDSPYLVRPLPEGETLLRRTKVTSEAEDDVFAAIVEGPGGRRLRLGLGGGDDYPLKSWTGGPGPMVADLGPDDAREVDETVESLLGRLDEIWDNQQAVMDELDEWDESPSGQRLTELRDKYDVYTTGDGQGGSRQYVVLRDPDRKGPRDQSAIVEAPPEVYAEVERLQAEASKIITDAGLLDDEGAVFDFDEVEAGPSVIRFEIYQWDLGTRPNVQMTVRPKDVDAETWEDDVVGQYEAYARLEAKQLKRLRKLVSTAFQDADGNPITKSEGAGMNAVYAWAPITKVEQQPDGTVMVYGPVSDAGLDRDKQRMNQRWLDEKMPQWMAEGANVREMHDPKRAVGVGFGLTRDPSGAHLLAAAVTDPVAAKKCMPGPPGPDGKPLYPPTLKGFSIGIKEPRLDMSKAEAPNGEIVGGYICEVSLVDRPANPRTMFTMVKADTPDGGLAPVEDPEVVEAGETEGGPNAWDESAEDAPEVPKVDAPTAGKRDFSARQRRTAARRGEAMPDGSFPINDSGSLHDAIHLWGNAKNPAAAKRHIISRARALGLTSQLPEDWGVQKAEQVAADLKAFTPEVAKADESGDISNATLALSLIARLIASEAMQMAAGRDEEADDIETLLGAYKALCWFKGREEAQAANPDGVQSDVDMVKDSPAMGYKTDNPDLVKAVAEAKKAEERAEDLAAQVAQLKADMAAMPKPGGPVLTKTAAAVRNTETNIQRQHEAAQLFAKADATSDPVLRAGYEQRAEKLLKADA